MFDPVTRRTMIGALGVGGLVAAVPPAFAHVRDGRLLLLDGGLSAREVALVNTSITYGRSIQLDIDLVRQWRDGLGEQVASAQQGALALVRWDKAFILAGLAREHRLVGRRSRLGRSLFSVTIGGSAEAKREEMI